MALLTLAAQIESNENAIEKVKNTQEYKIGSQSNRYALLRELQTERDYLLSLVTSQDDLSMTLVDLEIRSRNNGGRFNIGFI